MADPTISFGGALAYYPTGYPQNWQRLGVLRRRPEEDGADIIRFGRAPVSFSIMAVLFGATRPIVSSELARWEAELWQVDTLYITTAISRPGPGTTLSHVRALRGIQALVNSTNGAAFILPINLVFQRVAES